MSSCNKRDYLKKKTKLTTLCIFFSALSCKRPPRSRAPWERFASGLQQAIVSAFLRDGFGGQLQHLLSICSHSPLTSLQPTPAPAPPRKKNPPLHSCSVPLPPPVLSHFPPNSPVRQYGGWESSVDCNPKKKRRKPPETIDLVSCIWPSSPAGTKYHHL